ncbi:MAG TPA: DegT/DnrJ/EryC1/StrS family aminotransferase [Humidesulfovibrio sp.]|uniref:DegT/DnrJ/EryC1/StrS family aminotransferase n=1 Tax=Humidesulfovibrio sp. TaxID=2910988 RepID=UPI002BE7A16A|nr:DegT/DnrJ/EryC1/StrS family aminotransferase [Humidesulfovibrio sp.]HWR02979.1 DegT/DnrJ/EryC1/StrS family aminotransferase [Humidesulfovibrio sp.]
MSIPFIDLKTQYARVAGPVEQGLRAVLESGAFINGPEVVKLEKRLAEYCGTRHAVGCASGTDALMMALMVLKVGPGDAVFCPSFTFMATAEVVALLGATPVFVDMDPATFNIDAAQLETAIRAVETDDATLYPLPRHTGKLTPKAVIPVDLFGLLADYQGVLSVSAKHGLYVIEDAAQAFGATTELGGVTRRSCSFGQIACTSFFPAKPLGCYGDGGMCFTDDDELLALLQSVRVHGQGADKYQNVRLGITGRLDTMQAAVLLAKMDIFEDELRLRQEVAARYAQLLAKIPGLTLPHVPAGNLSVFAQYCIQAESTAHRTELLAKLAKAGVPTSIYYPVPLHLQPAYANLAYAAGTLPVSEAVAGRIFSIPMHPYLTAPVQEEIARAMAE